MLCFPAKIPGWVFYIVADYSCTYPYLEKLTVDFQDAYTRPALALDGNLIMLIQYYVYMYRHVRRLSQWKYLFLKVQPGSITITLHIWYTSLVPRPLSVH